MISLMRTGLPYSSDNVVLKIVLAPDYFLLEPQIGKIANV